ncbi:MAG: Zn-dependent hydrolase, including glyoxylase, partial [Oscillospiraceae bacterium]|nr:Zn-dependent hydrolase, including glyoxylase [Oscillospiraceae bacterium]
QKNNLTLKVIILTHGHFDHIGAAKELKEQSGAKVMIHEQDAEMLEDNRKNLAVHFDVYDYVPFKADALLKDGDTIELDELRMEVIHTPGHSKGSITLRFGNVLLAGDTLFKGSAGRTDHYGGDYQSLKKSLARLANLAGDYVVYSGHGPETTLATERRTNPYMGTADYDNCF